MQGQRQLQRKEEGVHDGYPTAQKKEGMAGIARLGSEPLTLARSWSRANGNEERAGLNCCAEVSLSPCYLLGGVFPVPVHFLGRDETQVVQQVACER